MDETGFSVILLSECPTLYPLGKGSRKCPRKAATVFLFVWGYVTQELPGSHCYGPPFLLKFTVLDFPFLPQGRFTLSLLPLEQPHPRGVT